MCSGLDRREVWSPGWRLVGGKPPQHDEPNLQALPTPRIQRHPWQRELQGGLGLGTWTMNP